MTAKMIVPADVSDCCIEGASVDLSTGYVMAKPEHIDVFLAHGFRIAGADEIVASDEFDAMTRDELRAWLKERGISAAPATKDETLRKIARETAVKAA